MSFTDLCVLKHYTDTHILYIYIQNKDTVASAAFDRSIESQRKFRKDTATLITKRKDKSRIAGFLQASLFTVNKQTETGLIEVNRELNRLNAVD